MNPHFVFHGDPRDRDRAFTRVRHALERDAGDPCRETRMPMIPHLEEHLKDHSVSVTPEADLLHVLTHPVSNPSWELTFVVTREDSVTSMIVWEIAPPPSR